MDWLRTILDGTILCIVFNVGVGFVWMIAPEGFTVMFPKELRRAHNDVPKSQLRALRVMEFILYPLLLVYMILSTYNAGVNGFWNLFWTAYIEMFFINLGDFFGLDWLLREKMKEKLKKTVPGKEDSPIWDTKGWMCSLAIKEHWILWPFILCPLVALVCAGIGMVIR
ncbi:MAG: hypothetical protein ACI4KR_02785 [Ruminiclostridium sp.]